jgi:hypothetical protein
MHLIFFDSRRKSLGKCLFSRRGGFRGRVREPRASRIIMEMERGMEGFVTGGG